MMIDIYYHHHQRSIKVAEIKGDFGDSGLWFASPFSGRASLLRRRATTFVEPHPRTWYEAGGAVRRKLVPAPGVCDRDHPKGKV
jgi:hypothetical protein